jgi:hypothetical protein
LSIWPLARVWSAPAGFFIGDPGWATCRAAHRHRLRAGAVWLA